MVPCAIPQPKIPLGPLASMWQSNMLLSPDPPDCFQSPHLAPCLFPVCDSSISSSVPLPRCTSDSRSAICPHTLTGFCLPPPHTPRQCVGLLMLPWGGGGSCGWNGWWDFDGSESRARGYVVWCVVRSIKPRRPGAEPAICLAGGLGFESCGFRWEVTAGLGPADVMGEGDAQGIWKAALAGPGR